MINVLRAVPLCLAGLAVSFAAHADHHHDKGPMCHDIRAELHELKTDENCMSPLAFCSAGTIDGNFGLDGTTFFSADGSIPAAEPAVGMNSFTGSYTITTPHGVLNMRETGTSYPRRGNPEGGVLASVVEVQSGTGRYESTTGILFFYGHNGRGLPSDISVAGTLCTTSSH
jgi:hypothetical protein